MASLSLIEQAKKKAAYAAVDEFVKDGMVLGIGSGSTVVYAVDRIIERVQKEGLKLSCIPSSFQAQQLIEAGKLNLEYLNRLPEIDVCIDGADEVDDQLNLIKGGGGCHVGEKIIACAAKKLVIIADYRKESHLLGQQWKKGVPIAIISYAYNPIVHRIKKMGGNPVLRMGGGAKAGPAITDDGAWIIDADFGVIQDPKSLHLRLMTIPGVIDTGLFIHMASKAFFGQEDGSVTTRENKHNDPRDPLDIGLTGTISISSSGGGGSKAAAGAGKEEEHKAGVNSSVGSQAHVETSEQSCQTTANS